MEHHITLVGNGTMLIDSANKNPPVFIVPHNFEIVFWTRTGSNIPDDYAANIEVSPESWYNRRAYTEVYTAGELCPNHRLLSTHSFSDRMIQSNYSISFCPFIREHKLLSAIIEIYQMNRLDYQLSGKIILHWCADRTLEFA